MVKFFSINVPGYEKVIEAIDESAGLHCLIAIHDTRLGPGLGGTRIFPYASREEALDDVLRLSEGMTYKSAISQVGTGGAKAVIFGDSKGKKSKEMLHAYGEVINSLNGEFITAEDVGTTTEEVAIMREVTPYLVGLPIEIGAGDPSPFTAHGVIRGIEATCQHLFGSRSVKGKRVAVQGLGKVGIIVAEQLFWQGAELILSDIDEKKAKEVAKRFHAEVVAPDEIYGVECDIFAPVALGGIINDKTIPMFRCKAIAGATNNQLLEERHGNILSKKGILYAPDFLINSGGLIQVTCEIDPDGYSAKAARDKIDTIYDTLLEIFAKADKEGRSTESVAIEIAKHNIANLIGKRKTHLSLKTPQDNVTHKKTSYTHAKNQ